MKKSLYIKAALLMFVMCLSQSLRAADEDVPCLKITETDGTIVTFALSEPPVITYANDIMTVSGVALTINVPLSEVVDLEFENTVANGIAKTVLGDGSAADASFIGGKAYISGLAAGAQVYVYTVDGQLVSSISASQEGSVCVDLGGLKSGVVYLLRTPAATYKIIK